MRMSGTLAETCAAAAAGAGRNASAGVALTARTVGATLGALAIVRHGKPIHTRGIVLSGILRRHGCDTFWGVPWIDEPREEPATVRLSRSAGLPAPFPDVMGIGLRAGDPLVDVLLSTTGQAPGLRHLLLPRRHVIGPVYGSMVPYKGPNGPVMLAAFPDDSRPVLADNASVLSALDRAPLRMTLAAATPTSRWQSFAELTLTARAATGELDPPISFDPVLHMVPGLEMYDVLARTREAAYRAARRGRNAPAGSLDVGPDAFQRSGS
jgi:hypothetical protein